MFWSPLPGPTPAAGEYTVRHGFGYTTFEHESHGLSQEIDDVHGSGRTGEAHRASARESQRATAAAVAVFLSALGAGRARGETRGRCRHRVRRRAASHLGDESEPRSLWRMRRIFGVSAGAARRLRASSHSRATGQRFSAATATRRAPTAVDDWRRAGSAARAAGSIRAPPGR